MSRFSVTAVKYGETTLPRRMVFADSAGDDTKVPISLVLYLIECNGKKILVDAGCDAMPGYDVQHHISPAEALTRCGVPPTDITDVILTHAHHDHIEAVHYFINANVHMSLPEYEKAIKRGLLPPNLHVSPFEQTRRIGEVCAVVWGGHSAGSLIVTFAHEGREYVISGDECYDRACLVERRPTGVSCNPRKSFDFVNTYSSDKYTVLLSHDGAILPGQNGYVKII
ncbi:MAG: MBL fold metallo-hydrolase [Clostridia bacterium]|nr:MBL fold metallo-hydrolase [Clostridia bacterium]MBQ9801989.1 MBL fold metallo-hydrolase [Clostridia bacterium]